MTSLTFFLPVSRFFFAYSILALWIYSTGVLAVAFLKRRSKFLLINPYLSARSSTEILLVTLFSMKCCALLTVSSSWFFWPRNLVNGDWQFRLISISPTFEQ